MNLSAYVKRAIYAIIGAVIIVFVLNKVVEAFVPGLFTAAQLNLIDILIYIVAFLYVIFGETWFGTSA